MSQRTSFRHRPSSLQDVFSTTSGGSNSCINRTTSTTPEVQSNDYDSDVSYEEVNQFGFGHSNDKSSGNH